MYIDIILELRSRHSLTTYITSTKRRQQRSQTRIQSVDNPANVLETSRQMDFETSRRNEGKRSAWAGAVPVNVNSASPTDHSCSIMPRSAVQSGVANPSGTGVPDGNLERRGVANLKEYMYPGMWPSLHGNRILVVKSSIVDGPAPGIAYSRCGSHFEQG